MDWNKSNTILIAAFLVVNIFLFGVVYVSDNFTQKYALEEKEEFLKSVEEILKQKNITISCDVPREIHKAPFLEIKYDIIYPSEILVNKFIGQYSGSINEEILYYENGTESIEIVGMKKLIYNNSKYSDAKYRPSDKTYNTDNIIKEFCTKKDIDIGTFHEVQEINTEKYKLVIFTEKYKGYNLENAYMNFYIKGGNIFKFEMQKTVSINERAYISSVSAAEALLRLMTFDDIRDKKIIDIQICYYTNEDKEFENINSITADLVWNVIFDDGSYVYLVSEEY